MSTVERALDEPPTRHDRVGRNPARDETVAGLASWLALFLLPSLAFKVFYLSEIYGTTGGALRLGLTTILDATGRGTGWPVKSLRLAHLLCIDVLEVTLAVALLYLLASLLLPRWRDAVLSAVLFVALVVTAANAVSVRQLGTLLTGETLSVAFHWLRDHPSTLGAFVSWPKTVALLGAVAWAAAPLALERLRRARSQRTSATPRLAPWVLAAAGLGSILGLGARLGMTHSAPRTFGGYWSSAVVALVGADDPHPCLEPLREVEPVVYAYRRLAFPLGHDATTAAPVAMPSGRLLPRHVLIVALETAPRKYYPLADHPDLPTLHRMAAHGIVTERHYTPVPVTKTALFSIVSGTYPRFGKGLQRFGDFESDSLATVLGKRGYETTFIDSYKIDWQPGLDDRRMLLNLGFRHLLDEVSDSPRHAAASYETLVENERRAFDKIRQAVLGAHGRGRKAFVLAATALGHFDWKAPAGQRDLPAPERILRLAAVIDGLLAELLDAVAAAGLDQEVLIVVTGDHGVRYGAEFAALHEPPVHGDVEYNVPFLLYGPGLFPGTVRLPYVTSHVDIAPTVLALLGIDDPSLLFHGSNMLDARLAARSTFMWDGDISPVGGLYHDGRHYSVNYLTGTVQDRPDPCQPGPPGARLADDAVRAALDEAGRVFDATGCIFLRRGSGVAPP
jgi:hypothetical protein